jgi:hypothetical protein
LKVKQTKNKVMNKQSYVRVDLGSRNEVEDLQLVVLDQPLISYLNSMYDELSKEVEDQEYFDEFVDFSVNEDQSLGYITKSEEESIYFISEEMFPGETSDLLEEEVDDETIMDILDRLFDTYVVNQNRY